uniref:CTNNB1 binding N-teminal domain-containing protein n=1 Tax=Periophthalmus magnuspinnatus TaxID=409849 RepID=A0A3B4A7B2_9GOBI
MPQLSNGGGDELGANDEMIAFKDEGEQEEKTPEHALTDRDLADLKSSLVNESESRQSPAVRTRPRPGLIIIVWSRDQQCEAAVYKPGSYPGYPLLMLPDPYLPNGAASPVSTRILVWSLLEESSGEVESVGGVVWGGGVCWRSRLGRWSLLEESSGEVESVLCPSLLQQSIMGDDTEGQSQFNSIHLFL